MTNLPNGLHEAQQIIVAQREQIAALKARVKAADELADDIESIVSASAGVAGLHMNGDIAPWASLLEGGNFEEWLASLAAYRATEWQDNE
jgi:hypothetical protein